MLNLEVQLAQAREDLIRAENSVKLAIAALNTSIGKELVTGQNLPAPQKGVPGPVFEQEDFKAVENRPELQAAHRQTIPFLVLLDGIGDPQNLGAIVRTAEGAGVDGIIIPERRSVPLTETVAVVASGALEHVKVARTKNLARTMEELRKKEVWLIGAEEGGDGLWHNFDYTVPIGLVFGSEGKGMRPLVRKKCDKVLSIPLLGTISSLNVAAAAAIFMYEVVRQRKSIRQ